MRKLLTIATICLSAVALPIVGDLAIRQRCFSEPAGDQAPSLAAAMAGDSVSPASLGIGSASCRRSEVLADSEDRVVFAVNAGPDGAVVGGTGVASTAASVAVTSANSLTALRSRAGADAGVLGLDVLYAGSIGSLSPIVSVAAAATADSSVSGTAVQTFALGDPASDRGGAPQVTRVRAVPAPLGTGNPFRFSPGTGPFVTWHDPDPSFVPDVIRLDGGHPLGDSNAPRAVLLASANTGSVPEPGSLLLVLLGLGLAGWTVLRAPGRHRTAA